MVNINWTDEASFWLKYIVNGRKKEEKRGLLIRVAKASAKDIIDNEFEVTHDSSCKSIK